MVDLPAQAGAHAYVLRICNKKRLTKLVLCGTNE